jgi:hypothetical protein
MTSSRVTVFDTTLRDGEQAPGCSMSLDEKLRLARELDKLGVDVIEAGFPISSQGDFSAVRAIAREVRRPIIAALARARKEDIAPAWEALAEAARPRIHIFLATSDIHLQFKLKITREDALQPRSATRARFAMMWNFPRRMPPAPTAISCAAPFKLRLMPGRPRLISRTPSDTPFRKSTEASFAPSAKTSAASRLSPFRFTATMTLDSR